MKLPVSPSKIKPLAVILILSFGLVKFNAYLAKDRCYDSGGAWHKDDDFCFHHQANSVDLVTVNKTDKTMILSKKGQAIRSFPVVFGANPVGHKQQEGDEKNAARSIFIGL